jgi:hypothetical protein
MTNDRNDGQLFTNPLVSTHRRSIFIKVPCNPFKVQVNFDISLFEGLIDADVLDKWLNFLEGYSSVHNFFDRENITFALIKVIPHVKDWWDTYSEQRAR